MEESQSLSLRQVRQHCMECSGDSAPAVMWCTGDGHNSTLCRLWPYRFGRRPESFRRKYGPWLLMPQCMPGANVELETLPGKLADTIQWFQEHHPEVEWDGPENWSGYSSSPHRHDAHNSGQAPRAETSLLTPRS